MRNERLKFNTLLNELAAIRTELEKISLLIESRLIGIEKPTIEEIRAIKEFERKRKEGKLKLIPLSKLK